MYIKPSRNIYKEPVKWSHVAFIYPTRMMTQFDLIFYHVYFKWLSCVNVISQLHVDISTSPSSCNYK